MYVIYSFHIYKLIQVVLVEISNFVLQFITGTICLRGTYEHKKQQ